jgi:hypothetical protein
MLSGLIKRQDEFDGLAAFGAVDRGWSAGADRLDGVDQVKPVPAVADRLGVGRAGATGLRRGSEEAGVGG